jgi:hypothetical protein
MIKWTTAVLVALMLTAGLDARGQQEGLKVRGHWAIDIRQPDGTLVEHVEFDNALQDGGKGLLSRLLSRQNSTGLWSVAFRSGGQVQACGWYDCYMAEPNADRVEAPSFAKNLTVESVGHRIVLRGSTTVTEDGEISVVFTTLGTCSSTERPYACRDISDVPFTSHNLSPRMAFTSGQIIQFKVTLTVS